MRIGRVAVSMCGLRRPWQLGPHQFCLGPASSAAAMAVGSSPVLSGSDLPAQSAGSGSRRVIGVKKRQVGAVDSKPSVLIQEPAKEDAALLQKSEKTVQILWDCLGSIASQSDMFWQLLRSVPLVDARDMHREALLSMERACLSCRNELERALEAVEDMDVQLSPHMKP